VLDLTPGHRDGDVRPQRTLREQLHCSIADLALQYSQRAQHLPVNPANPGFILILGRPQVAFINDLHCLLAGGEGEVDQVQRPSLLGA
jgi:hypothetical protein